MKKEDIVLGKMHILTSTDWCSNKKEKEYFTNTKIETSFVLAFFNGELQIRTRYFGWMTVPASAIEPDPTDKRELSKEIIELASKLREFKFIQDEGRYQGGCLDKLNETTDSNIKPMFCLEIDREDEEVIMVPFDYSHDFLSKHEVKKLLKEKSIIKSTTGEHRHTRVFTLGNNKEELRKDYRWPR